MVFGWYGVWLALIKRDLYCIREYGYYIRTDSLFGLIKGSIVFGAIRGYIKYSVADIIFGAYEFSSVWIRSYIRIFFSGWRGQHGYRTACLSICKSPTRYSPHFLHAPRTSTDTTDTVRDPAVSPGSSTRREHFSADTSSQTSCTRAHKKSHQTQRLLL